MKKKLFIAIPAVIVLAAILNFVLGGDVEPEAIKNSPETIIKTSLVSDLSKSSAPIGTYGQVVSTSGVTVVPEISGVVARVNKNLGATVRAGETVVVLQNTAQSQALLQAQASLSTAQANLARVEGSQPEDLANLEAALLVDQNSLASVRANSRQSISSAYTAALSAFESTLDQFFTDEQSPEFVPQSNSQIAEQQLVFAYTNLQSDLDVFADYVVTINENTNLDTPYDRAIDLIDQTISVVQDTLDRVNTVSVSVSASESTISAWKTSLLTQKTSLENFRGTLTNGRAGLANAREAVSISENNLARAENATLSSDVIVAQNNVNSARASLTAAQDSLSKTQIKSPIFGTISDIDLRVGDLVGPSAPAFVVANDTALRIDTSLTPSEVAQISIGSAAVIDGRYDARVSNISPAVNQTTGKVKIELFLNSDAVRLTEGAGVSVEIDRKQIDATDSEILVPIEAIFVRSDIPYVYVLDSERKAIPTQITVDSLFGERVSVTGGINQNDEIVLFARTVDDNQVIRQSNNPN